MSYYMHDIAWPEFQAKKDSVVILPIGATEQLRSICRCVPMQRSQKSFLIIWQRNWTELSCQHCVMVINQSR